MAEYCLLLTVKTPLSDALQELRVRFDPLYSEIPPHITVIFPFTFDGEPARLEKLITGSIRATSFLDDKFSLGETIEDSGYLYYFTRQRSRQGDAAAPGSIQQFSGWIQAPGDNLPSAHYHWPIQNDSELEAIREAVSGVDVSSEVLIKSAVLEIGENSVLSPRWEISLISS